MIDGAPLRQCACPNRGRGLENEELRLREGPDPANDMCGRGGFLIHGDSTADPGTASQGCIILNRSQREQIAANPVKLLRVVERMA